MRRLSDTIAQLSALRGAADKLVPAGGTSRLAALGDFGSNPGALLAQTYVPAGLRAGAPLVVVLHGCTQTAAGYDHGVGWSQLADRHGFALLFPEQQRGNNANLCFNWFNPDDIRRGAGEALSIRQMVAAMLAAHSLDPARVFVTGLSAGGAMTAVMLATYPDVFAAGAVIAGLPYGTARSVPEAFERMRGAGAPAAGALAKLVTDASDHRGPWPRISIWHGDRDATVAPANASLLVDQWRVLHGVPAQPSRVETAAGHVRRIWQNAAGRDVIEEHRIAAMGHGTPVSTSGIEACGTPGPYMLDVGISSSYRIAESWGLISSETVSASAPAPTARTEHRLRWDDDDRSTPSSRPKNVGTIIEDALRAAGLMR